MPHLCKLGFEFAALPPNLARLLLGACPAAGLFLQSFRQLFALFLQFDFRLLQLIDPQTGLEQPRRTLRLTPGHQLKPPQQPCVAAGFFTSAPTNKPS